MNSILSAATTVSETIWGKKEDEAKAGVEPPNETPADAPETKSPPFDPGNTVDTAPEANKKEAGVETADATASVSASAAADPVAGAASASASASDPASAPAPAIPAPGNDPPASAATEGAGPTATEETAEKKEAAEVKETKEAAETKEGEAKDAGGAKKEEKAKAAAKDAKEKVLGTPAKLRDESPASTPGSTASKSSFRKKLKEKLKGI